MSSFDLTDQRLARCSKRMPGLPTQLVTLSRLAYHIQKRTQDLINASMKKYNLTTTSYTALMVLYGSEDETQRASELGEACSEKPANMTRICNDLASRGLIVRRNSEQDRRGVSITLSNAGRALVETVTPEYWAIVRRTYADLNDKALKEHENMLRRQLGNLEA